MGESIIPRPLTLFGPRKNRTFVVAVRWPKMPRTSCPQFGGGGGVAGTRASVFALDARAFASAQVQAFSVTVWVKVVETKFVRARRECV